MYLLLKNLNEKILGNILTYANAAAALITLKKGAIRSMPTPNDILNLIKGEKEKDDDLVK